MCGIAGQYVFNETVPKRTNELNRALVSLFQRGPDRHGIYQAEKVLLGHTRLSIIDTSEAASQPFTDASGRYTIVFNGEVYNFKQLRNLLSAKNISFRSESDTEVLLHWLIEKGSSGINELQGFFAFAFFDRQEGTLLLVRDRFGIKPLYFYQDEDQLIFASEMKAMMALGVPKVLDRVSLSAYLHLNYIPGPWSIFERVYKLEPGHWIKASSNGIENTKYYKVESFFNAPASHLNYHEAQSILKEKLAQAVKKRLVADVPLGAFLSGGIDSSIITALAAKEVSGLNTFSIGFKDEPMFDETNYARLVAKMHKTNHTEFLLTTNDLLNGVFDVLDYIDEPFADSSALAVHILSRETRKKVTVALSGDGADELFAGYNKHMAEWRILNQGFSANLIKWIHPITNKLPQSRNNFYSNKIRQINRFANGMKLPAKERYWQWAGFTRKNDLELLLEHFDNTGHLENRKATWLKNISDQNSISRVLFTDMQLVLPYDMLTKVDLMSMANSLEVRVPFLDHDLVHFVFSLPDHFKIDKKQRKKILRDAFRQDLPPELYQRNKQGFEVPLLRWFRNELKSLIEEDLLQKDFIAQQGIFNFSEIEKLLKQLNSGSPGEAPARIWGLIVFQYWWKKNMV